MRTNICGVTEQKAIFLDWSSSCKLYYGKPNIHQKRYYKGLKTGDFNPAQLMRMDLDAAMFAFNDYVRQAIELVDKYLDRLSLERNDFADGNIMTDNLGSLICPSKGALLHFRGLVCNEYVCTHGNVSENSKASAIKAARQPFLQEVHSLWMYREKNPAVRLPRGQLLRDVRHQYGRC